MRTHSDALKLTLTAHQVNVATDFPSATSIAQFGQHCSATMLEEWAARNEPVRAFCLAYQRGMSAHVADVEKEYNLLQRQHNSMTADYHATERERVVQHNVMLKWAARRDSCLPADKAFAIHMFNDKHAVVEGLIGKAASEMAQRLLLQQRLGLNRAEYMRAREMRQKYDDSPRIQQSYQLASLLARARLHSPVPVPPHLQDAFDGAMVGVPATPPSIPETPLHLMHVLPRSMAPCLRPTTRHLSDQQFGTVPAPGIFQVLSSVAPSSPLPFAAALPSPPAAPPAAAAPSPAAAEPPCFSMEPKHVRRRLLCKDKTQFERDEEGRVCYKRKQPSEFTRVHKAHKADFALAEYMEYACWQLEADVNEDHTLDDAVRPLYTSNTYTHTDAHTHRERRRVLAVPSTI